MVSSFGNAKFCERGTPEMLPVVMCSNQTSSLSPLLPSRASWSSWVVCDRCIVGNQKMEEQRDDCSCVVLKIVDPLCVRKLMTAKRSQHRVWC